MEKNFVATTAALTDLQARPRNAPLVRTQIISHGCLRRTTLDRWFFSERAAVRPLAMLVDCGATAQHKLSLHRPRSEDCLFPRETLAPSSAIPGGGSPPDCDASLALARSYAASFSHCQDVHVIEERQESLRRVECGRGLA